jgi:hypothetical protein
MEVITEYIRNNAQEKISSVECIIRVHNTEWIKCYNFVYIFLKYYIKPIYL